MWRFTLATAATTASATAFLVTLASAFVAPQPWSRTTTTTGDTAQTRVCFRNVLTILLFVCL